MKYLTNLTTKDTIKWFGDDWGEIRKFIDRNRLNGIELMLEGNTDISKISKDCVVGMHLKYWPLWLDFWRGDRSALLEQFANFEDVKAFYGGLDKNVLIDYYKREWEIAEALEVEYVVFHVAHVDLLATYTWEFKYSDWDVLEATCELANKAFGSKDRKIKLLFENLWWPGLKLTDAPLAKRFLDQIEYPRKGFMLDIGHLMVTNPQIKSEEEACDYICTTIDQLGNLKKYIKGIHLNKSLSGKYLKKEFEKEIRTLKDIEDFWGKMDHVKDHILNIDHHVPFNHPDINKVINDVKPEYLVLEFLSDSLRKLEQMLKVQREVLRIN